MTGHQIKLTLDSDGVNAEFVCEEPNTAECHQACTYGCEIADEECVANHPRETTTYCNPIEFVDNTGSWYETFLGEETEARSGPVSFEWQDDWYGWRYNDEQWEDWGSDENIEKPSWVKKLYKSFMGGE